MGRAGGANNGHEFEGAGPGASFHADQHDIPETSYSILEVEDNDEIDCDHHFQG